MTFDVFKRELQVIAAAQAIVEKEQVTTKDYEALLKSYEKLFKSTKRLVKLSDRNEEELNKIAKALDEKNATLESLSGKLGKYLSPKFTTPSFPASRMRN